MTSLHLRDCRGCFRFPSIQISYLERIKRGEESYCNREDLDGIVIGKAITTYNEVGILILHIQKYSYNTPST